MVIKNHKNKFTKAKLKEKLEIAENRIKELECENENLQNKIQKILDEKNLQCNFLFSML